VVYGKRENGIAYCPVVKEIIRIPKEPPKSLSKVGRKKGNNNQSRRSVALTNNPEEGWDDSTPLTGVVIDWQTKDEVQRRMWLSVDYFICTLLKFITGIAFPSSQVEYRAAENEEFYFQKIFGDGEFIAAGQLLIPPNGQKPTKGTKDNTYVRPPLLSTL